METIVTVCLKCKNEGELENGDACQECCEHQPDNRYVCDWCDKALDPGDYAFDGDESDHEYYAEMKRRGGKL